MKVLVIVDANPISPHYLVQKLLVGYICVDTIHYGHHLHRTEPAHITGLPEHFREFSEYEKILDQILVRV